MADLVDDMTSLNLAQPQPSSSQQTGRARGGLVRGADFDDDRHHGSGRAGDSSWSREACGISSGNHGVGSWGRSSGEEQGPPRGGTWGAERAWSVCEATSRDDVPRYYEEGGNQNREIWGSSRQGYQRDSSRFASAREGYSRGGGGGGGGWGRDDEYTPSMSFSRSREFTDSSRDDFRGPPRRRSDIYKDDFEGSFYRDTRDDFYSRSGSYASRVPIGANRPRYVTPTLPAYREQFVESDESESGFGKVEVASPRTASPDLALLGTGEWPHARPARPGHGTAGRKIRLLSNHFKLKCPDRNVHHYEVEIEPAASSALNRTLFEVWVRQPRPAASADIINLVVYDGQKSIYSPEPLPESEIKMGHVLEVVEEGERHSQQYTLRLHPLPQISMSRLHAFMNRQSTEYPHDALQVLEVLLRHRPSSLFVTIGKTSSSFFSKADQAIISGGLSVYRGWYQSVRVTGREVLLNLDTSATSFYRSGPLIDVISEFFGARRITDIPKLQFLQSLHHLSRFLRGLKVDTTYTPANGRTKYRIEGISDKSADTARILIDGQPPMSIAQYYRSRYDIVLLYPFLPCAQVGAKKGVLIPIELCVVRGNQRFLGRLNEFQLADMIKITATKPEGRVRRVEDGKVGLHGKTPTDLLQKWGVELSPNLQLLEGRVLSPAPLRFNRTTYTPQDGTWKYNDRLSFSRPAPPLTYWSVVVFASSRDIPPERVQGFVRSLVQACEEKGLAVGNVCPDIVYARGSILESLEKGAERACVGGGEGYEGGGGNGGSVRPQLVLCILRNKNLEYNEIKRIAETEMKPGLMTQIALRKHVEKAAMAYAGNLALKINSKLGGVNVTLDLRDTKVLKDNVPMLILGADVTHPPPGAGNGVSIAAVVGSIDREFAEYRASIRLQPGTRRDTITHLKDMVKELLQLFHTRNGVYPKRVLFYRDGVSESMYGDVVLNEVPQIREAFKEVGAKVGRVTFVSVNKRHHVRFFPVGEGVGGRGGGEFGGGWGLVAGDRSGNVPAGTVVDSSITHPSEFDFFLNSHPGLQGTSRPAHYHVLYDENQFSADELQEVSYRLCYLYARSTRAVGLVPPAYYAHLVAARARCHVHSSDAADLSGGTRGEGDAQGQESEEGVCVSVGSLEDGMPNVNVVLRKVEGELQRRMYFT
ncbi:hypothetical protein HDV00_011383 [Rhizophlyctis rosea]|nr:hypothetical protein HDV00_011383 [Rhizophlyctis rosea]